MTSAIKKLRREWKWELAAPVCATCVHYRKPHPVLFESVPRLMSSPWCRKGDFWTKPTAACDRWTNQRGDVVSDTSTNEVTN